MRAHRFVRHESGSSKLAPNMPLYPLRLSVHDPYTPSRRIMLVLHAGRARGRFSSRRGGSVILLKNRPNLLQRLARYPSRAQNTDRFPRRSLCNFNNCRFQPDTCSSPVYQPSILPDKSSATCSASVGLGRPERFALGAAIGQPDASIRRSAVSC